MVACRHASFLARRIAVLVWTSFAVASTANAQRAGGASRGGPVPRPTLVVVITVDQMKQEYFARFESQLTGGLARLYRQGAVFTNAFQDHANTETAPGHATILSGREPRSTGIVINVLGVADSQAKVIGGGGTGASPYRFRGSTLIDWLRVDDPRSRALSVARKDRGAILPLGRAKQSVFWYAIDGRFTTSTYYADTLPDWVKQFNSRRLPQSYAGRAWGLILPASEYPERDSVPAESSGRNFLFPHVVPSDSAAAARAFAEFPWMDDVTAQLALTGVTALGLGTGPAPDLLAVSFSTTDAVGHRYGPDSRELHDQIIRLDRLLGSFIDSLYKLRDSSRIIFALTADHGVTSFPEVQRARGATGTAATSPRWVNMDSLVARFRRALTAAQVPRDAFVFDDGIVEVDREAFAAARVNADSVIRAFAAEARRWPGVARVDYLKRIAPSDTVNDRIARRWFNAVPPDLHFELGVSLVNGSVWGTSGSAARHGGVNDDDAHVPVIFYGPAFVAGRHAQRARVSDIAPTLAAVLGITPTERLDGRALTVAIRRR